MIRQQIDRYNQYIPYPQYLKLLLRATDATTSGIKDFSGYGKVVTNATGATGSTGAVKLNPYSMYFDGSDDVISVPDSVDWDFGIGDFTISFWLYPSTLPSSTNSHNIISQYVDDNNYQNVRLYGDGTLYFENKSASTIITQFHITHGMSVNTWYHIVINRNINTPYIYINGIPLSVTEDTTISGKTLGNIASALYTGARVSTNYMNAYLGHVGIWKGTAIPISQLYPQTKPFSFRRA